MILRRLLSFLNAPLIIGTLPNTISNGQPIDAVPVMADFNYIVSQVNTNAAALALTPQLGSVNTFTAVQNGVAATGRSNFPIAAQIQDGALTYVTTIAGTNTVTGTAPLTMTAYATGSFYWYVPANSNTGGLTVNWNSIGAVTVLLNGIPLAGYETRAGRPVCVFYDGTHMNLVAGVFGGDGIPVGAVVNFGGSATPQNLLLAYGQAISQVSYADLFAVFGTTYGGSGGNFNLPDMRGRAVFGVDNMGGSAANRVTNGVSGITGTTLGATGGDQNVQSHTHANTLNDPTHQHSIFLSPQNVTGSGSIPGGLSGAGTTGSVATGITITNANYGSGASMNMPPTMMLNVGIKF